MNKENVDIYYSNGNEYKIVEKYEKLICVRPHGVGIFKSNGNNAHDLKFGQIVYNVIIIESGSVIFSLKNNSDERYIVSNISNFKPISDDILEKVTQIKYQQKIYRNAIDKINEIVDSM